MARLYFLSVFVLALSFYISPSSGCDLPPNLWCSSKETARNCQVEKQCEAFVWSVRAKPVQFALYYESLCPDCQVFFKNQLWPTFQKVSAILNITLVPYGFASQQAVGDHWKFTCQHGPNECVGNIIETCAIHLLKKQETYMPFLACIEMNTTVLPNESAPDCARQHGFGYDDIRKCSMGGLGNSLEHAMAEMTNRLDPHPHYVPYVTLSGIHTEKMQDAAMENLLKLVCDTYQGPPPEACTLKTSSQKCFRNENFNNVILNDPKL